MDKTKTSEQWFWITLDKNYAMTNVFGWYDVRYYLLDYWYTIPITKKEYLIRSHNSNWVASRDLIYHRRWHPFGRYRYVLSFERQRYLFFNYNPYWLKFYNCYKFVKDFSDFFRVFNYAILGFFYSANFP